MTDEDWLMQGIPFGTCLIGKALRGPAAWSSVPGIPLTSWQDRIHADDTSGWVYAIVEAITPLVKIGYTRFGTLQRLKNLAYEIQAHVILVGAIFVPQYVTYVERQVHYLLGAQRIEREWFYTYMNQQMLATLVSKAVLAVYPR